MSLSHQQEKKPKHFGKLISATRMVNTQIIISATLSSDLETAPVSSSSWLLLSVEQLVPVSSESLRAWFSAPSTSSGSRSLSEDEPPREGALHTSRLQAARWHHKHCGGYFIICIIGCLWNQLIKSSCRGLVSVCRHLRVEVLQGGESGCCRSRLSLSLMLIVSSGASRHTKIQLTDKSIRALKIQHLIPAWLLRKWSANTFPCSFPPAAEPKDVFLIWVLYQSPLYCCVLY